jgi:hypothetical protein
MAGGKEKRKTKSLDNNSDWDQIDFLSMILDGQPK